MGSSSITTTADGTWNSEIRYSAFGETRYSSGITPTDYRYTGQLEQADVNLYYYNARYYDAALGRFVQADTIVPEPILLQDWDCYSYVRNNPLIYSDPSGNKVEEGLGGYINPSKVDWKPYIKAYENVYNRLDYSQYNGNLKEYFATVTSYYYSKDSGIQESIDRNFPETIAAKYRLVVNGYIDVYTAQKFAVDLGGLDPASMSLGIISTAQFALKSMDAGYATRFITGSQIKDQNGNITSEGTVDLRPTLERIAEGKSYPHRNDGTTFHNNEGFLPIRIGGYYKEYVVPTVNQNTVGPQRIIIGAGGDIFYTPDHYATFFEITY
ncbi:MAG: hypothetical protein JEZ00_09610 [Anaerolineaceae bacterium]|nr:hypothetical protein [Anaerolineaceae bacterium]